MKRLIPLALMGCTKLDSNLQSTTAERCAPQVQALIEACEEANVIGTNENSELYKAVDDVRECIGGKTKIVCSDTGSSKVVTLKQFHQW